MPSWRRLLYPDIDFYSSSSSSHSILFFPLESDNDDDDDDNDKEGKKGKKQTHFFFYKRAYNSKFLYTMSMNPHHHNTGVLLPGVRTLFYIKNPSLPLSRPLLVFSNMIMDSVYSSFRFNHCRKNHIYDYRAYSFTFTNANATQSELK